MINVSLKVIIKKTVRESKMSFYMWIRFFYCDPKIYHLFLYLVCHYYVCWCFVIINELSCVTVSLSSSFSLNSLESRSEVTSITYFWHYCYQKKVRLLTFNGASIVIIFLSLNLYCYVLDLSKHVVIIVALRSREQCNEMFLFV